MQCLFSPDRSQFPHRFESEDHARPWFCLVFRFSLEVASFPIGLSPRTMQDLGSIQYLEIFFGSNQVPHRFESEDHARPWFFLVLRDFFGSNQFPHRFESENHARPWFCLVLRFSLEVASFPIGLSPRTMQDLGSVQYLEIVLEVTSFPIGLSPRTIHDLGSVQYLDFPQKQLVSPQV